MSENQGTKRDEGTLVTESKAVELPRALTVKELGDLLSVSAVEIIKELMKNGVMASINQVIDFDTAAIVATDFGFDPRESDTAEKAEVLVERVTRETVDEEEDPATLQKRPPVVTILGHVDHGKTSLLDVIREANVTASEAGGITQHIGAYQVEVNGEKITFLDTPGHEAFTAMRARGSQVTDIAVLVVAADDGVMPTTIEALNHARAAGVPIIIAVNKIDLEGADPSRVLQQLTQYEVLVEQYGGDVPAVNVSARTREGIPDLLENILLIAEIQDLKANPDRPAAGAVIEAQLTTQQGPVATLLVQKGTLRTGDALVAGNATGKIKAMFDERGRTITSAGPSMPVKVLGLHEVALAGDTFEVVKDEKVARADVETLKRARDAALLREAHPVNLDSLFGEIHSGILKDLNIILKTDVQGSIEPIRHSLERLSNEEVQVKIIHSGSGTITESDAMLAVASKGIIIGFNAKPDAGAKKIAESEKVEIRQYSIIYNLIEDVEKAIKGMLEPVFIDVINGHAEVRQIFKISRLGNIAGCQVLDGTLHRSDLVRVMRNGEKIADTRCASLKRFTEDVREVQSGYECGIQLEGFNDVKEGDIFEFYHRAQQT
ncbi:MAG: translation initiation factor IF-2 [Dehalococcoidia bacterium]|nr:translation initiation factor IF-2 [Dehalococcoidia bacterium]